MYSGNTFDVLSGPVCTVAQQGHLNWWKVKVGSKTGWMPEGYTGGPYWIEPAPKVVLTPDFDDVKTCEGSAQLREFQTYKVDFLCGHIPRARDVNDILTAANHALNSLQCWLTIRRGPWQYVGAIYGVPISLPMNGPEILEACRPEGEDLSTIFSSLKRRATK